MPEKSLDTASVRSEPAAVVLDVTAPALIAVPDTQEPTPQDAEFHTWLSED